MNYSFLLNEKEIEEYYQYIICSLPKTQRRFLWLRVSVPALLIFTLFFFHFQYNLLSDFIVIVISFIWYAYLSNLVWKKTIDNKINSRFLKENNINVGKRVNINFEEKIMVDNKQYRYQQINKVVPLESLLLFLLDSNEAFMIPYASIGNEENIKEVYRYILKMKGSVV